MDVMVLSSDQAERPIHVEYPIIKDAEPLTQAMKTWVDALTGEFIAEQKPSSTAPPELFGDWVVLNAGPTVGVQLDLYRFYGASGDHSAGTFFYDTARREVFTGADLIAPDKLSDAVGVLLDALRAQGRTPDPSELTTDADRRQLFTATAFDASGNVTVIVPEGVLTPYSDGSSVTTIPFEKARPFLVDRVDALREPFAASRKALDARIVPVEGPPSASPTASASASETTKPTASSPAPVSQPTTVPADTSVNCRVKKCVALTFDDGPSKHTVKILDALQAAGVKATFFVLGQSASARPAILRKVVDAGMVIGNHTEDHKQLTRLSADAQRQQVRQAARSIVAAGGPTPGLFRPPYGAFNADTRALGLPIILWDVDSEDWKNRSVQVTTDRVLSGARSGSIVLLHDIHPSTADAVPGIIRGLQAKGFTLVTVPQLLGATEGGRTYSRRRG